MKGSITAAIPDGLLDEIVKLKPLLELTGGSIQRRPRDGTYRLRVRVEHPDHGRVHKSITLGDDQTAYAVQMLIDAWREEHEVKGATAEREREEERAYAEKVKELRSAVLAQASGPSQRRRMAREFDKAAKNPTELHSYLIGGRSRPCPPGRPGPKPRSGLC